MTQGVLTIAEQSDGTFKKTTYEALSTGRTIADQLGAEMTVLVLGSAVGDKAGDLAPYGADKIIVADNPQLADYLTDTYTTVAAEQIGNLAPSVIVIGASTQGKDLAARLSARLNAPLATDCVGVKFDGDQIIVSRPMYGGKLMADVKFTAKPAIIAVRPNAMEIREQAGAGAIETVSAEPGESCFKIVEKKLEQGRVELTEADIVVSGGRGMGGADYSIIEALADTLGGAVGASRSAVDEGWRPHADQVGQTGKTVSPNLYVACGISGAIQHLAGMSSSKVIVAINKDEEAPIFNKADYGIVGDLFEIVPLINEEIKKVKA